MEWSVRVGDSEPGKRLVILAVALIGAVVGFWLIGLGGAIFGFGAIFFSAAEYFLPYKYRLTEEEASSKMGLSTSVIRWENVRRLIDVPGGVRLSPLASESRLDAFRGVSLRFSGNRDEVLGKIAELTQRYGIDLEREAESQ
jgi:hypothetical protein